jgi:hypothetical protein
LVAESWALPIQIRNKARALHIKLSCLTKTLKRWNREHTEEMKWGTHTMQQQILQLDQLQEQRQLTDAEQSMFRAAKNRLNRLIGLAAVRKIKLPQRSRLTWIKLGDTNSKLFHLRSNARRRRNFIPSLWVMDREVTVHEDKAAAPHAHFASHFGQPQPRHQTLNWEALHIPRHDLSHLDADLSESQIDAAIAQLPAEKAPGPDGYIGAFFKQCWSIVKQNVVAAIREIFNLRGECWNLLNSANVALIAKIEEPQAIGDYRPIGIMHNMGKLLGKVLANQLSPHRIKLFHTARVLS